MIIDCFTYMNERDILKARINLLREVVDRFVIVEADSTFQGSPRQLDFPSVRSELGISDDAIRYVVVENLPAEHGAWACERITRDAIMLGLDDVEPDALIILSDADEIIRPDVMLALEESLQSPAALEVRYFTFRVNWEWDNLRADPRAARRRDLVSPHELRRRKGIPTIDAAGWHISWLGDEVAIRAKLQSFSHTEMDDLSRSSTHIERCMRLGVDLLGRGVLRRVTDAEVIPTLDRSRHPELWAQPRSAWQGLVARVYNFAIPGLRALRFPTGPIAILGFLLAVPLRIWAVGKPSVLWARRAARRFFRRNGN